MSAFIDNETIEYVGILAKLFLNENEKEQARIDIQKMLEYVDKLNEVNTDGIEPMSHVFPLNNVFRDDIVTNKDDREALLFNAPEKADGQFEVPKTVE